MTTRALCRIVDQYKVIYAGYDKAKKRIDESQIDRFMMRPLSQSEMSKGLPRPCFTSMRAFARLWKARRHILFLDKANKSLKMLIE